MGDKMTRTITSLFTTNEQSREYLTYCAGYSDGTTERISKAEFTRLVNDGGFCYDASNAIYWYDVPEDAPKSGSVQDLAIANNLQELDGDISAGGMPPIVVMPGAIVPNGRRVVHVQNMDGTTITDADWLARQYEKDDYNATVEAASYRAQ